MRAHTHSHTHTLTDTAMRTGACTDIRHTLIAHGHTLRHRYAHTCTQTHKHTSVVTVHTHTHTHALTHALRPSCPWEPPQACMSHALRTQTRQAQTPALLTPWPSHCLVSCLADTIHMVPRSLLQAPQEV